MVSSTVDTPDIGGAMERIGDALVLLPRSGFVQQFT